MQNRLIQTSRTGGQWYSDTSPFGIPWLLYCKLLLKSYELNCVQIVTKGQWKGFTEEQNDRWQHFAEKKDTKGTYKHIGGRLTYRQTDQ